MDARRVSGKDVQGLTCAEFEKTIATVSPCTISRLYHVKKGVNVFDCLSIMNQTSFFSLMKQVSGLQGDMTSSVLQMTSRANSPTITIYKKSTSGLTGDK